MIKILIVSFFGSISYAIGYSGRFGLVFLKRGSLMHRVLGRINLAFHVMSAVIALILPSLTRYAGMPALAYIAGS